MGGGRLCLIGKGKLYILVGKRLGIFKHFLYIYPFCNFTRRLFHTHTHWYQCVKTNVSPSRGVKQSILHYYCSQEQWHYFGFPVAIVLSVMLPFLILWKACPCSYTCVCECVNAWLLCKYKRICFQLKIFLL